MSHLSVFFNNQFVREFDVREGSFKLGYMSTYLGDFFFRPIRYVFDGEEIRIGPHRGCCNTTEVEKVNSQTFNQSYLFGPVHGPIQKMLKTVGIIVTFVIGLPFGIFFKGLGYFSAEIRERHRLVVMHYTPLDRTLGSLDDRLDLARIKQQFANLNYHNHLRRRTNVLKIWAESGTIITDDPGILSLKPQKVILIGANLGYDQDNKGGSLAEKISFDVGKSVKEAEEDLPPRISLFSFARHKMFYCAHP